MVIFNSFLYVYQRVTCYNCGNMVSTGMNMMNIQQLEVKHHIGSWELPEENAGLYLGTSVNGGF